jgi:hypothetical protein
MNWRWLTYDHVPPELGLDRAERRSVRREVRQGWGIFDDRSLGARVRIIAGCLGGIAIVAIMFVFKDDLEAAAPGGTGTILFWMIYWIVLYYFSAVFWRSLYERKTWRVLRKRGYDLCAECGYLLKGLPGDQGQCPECGGEIGSRATLPAPSKADP